MARLAVFASGTGTNFAALAEGVSDTAHDLAYLICNVPNAPVIEKARSRNIPVHIVSYRGRPRSAAEADIEAILTDDPVDLIALAGFMKILSPRLVDRFRFVNVHPSLLPRHPGTHAVERSFNAGDAELGVTVHQVDHGVDTGPILAQARFRRAEATTLDEVERRIHILEHTLYPKVVVGLLDAVGRSNS